MTQTAHAGCWGPLLPWLRPVLVNPDLEPGDCSGPALRTRCHRHIDGIETMKSK